MDDYDDLQLIFFKKNKDNTDDNLVKYLYLNNSNENNIETLRFEYIIQDILKSILLTILNYLTIKILNYNKFLEGKKLIIFNFITLLFLNYIIIHFIF